MPFTFVVTKAGQSSKGDLFEQGVWTSTAGDNGAIVGGTGTNFPAGEAAITKITSYSVAVVGNLPTLIQLETDSTTKFDGLFIRPTISPTTGKYYIEGQGA
jgi:hypothetical protein